jgi:exodeoxyribonuclease-3
VEYSWWSQRGAARANNVGWRIDYQLATPGIAACIKDAVIFPEPKFSDHAPCLVEYADV